MARLSRRLALVLTVIVAFVTLQTGAACAVANACADECDEGDDDCDDEPEDAHDGPCAPVCVDCPGCPGPASAVLHLPTEPTLVPLADDAALPGASELRRATTDTERLERPPRV